MHPADQIRALAKQHGVTAERSLLDGWSDVITQLSDDEPPAADPVLDLLVNLARADVIDGRQMLALHSEYRRANGQPG